MAYNNRALMFTVVGVLGAFVLGAALWPTDEEKAATNESAPIALSDLEMERQNLAPAFHEPGWSDVAYAATAREAGAWAIDSGLADAIRKSESCSPLYQNAMLPPGQRGFALPWAFDKGTRCQFLRQGSFTLLLVVGVRAGEERVTDGIVMLADDRASLKENFTANPLPDAQGNAEQLAEHVAADGPDVTVALETLRAKIGR